MFDSILTAAARLPEAVYPAGTELISEGVVPDQLYVLIGGTVEVTRNGVQVTVVEEPGALFGEMAVLLNQPASATVATATECRFRVTDAPREFLTASPEVALAVATLLAQRLDRLIHYLVDVKAQYADRSDHLGVVDRVLESLVHHQAPAADTGSDRETEAPY